MMGPKLLVCFVPGKRSLSVPGCHAAPGRGKDMARVPAQPALAADSPARPPPEKQKENKVQLKI